MTELFIALSAGLISFLSPCVLPIIPGYIAYICGSTLEDLLDKKNTNLLPIFLFTVGFSIVFIIFGASATFLGKFLSTYLPKLWPKSSCSPILMLLLF